MTRAPSSNDMVQVHIELEGAPDDTLHIVSLEGREALSHLFELKLTAVSTYGLQAEAMLGLGAAVVWSRGGEELRRMFGIISAVHDAIDTESSHSTFRLVFVPRAFRMTLHETLDIFMDLSVPDIVEKKLQLAGLTKDIDYELRLVETYAKREFVVQYRESDLAFISRLTEHLGLTFFFEHRDGRDIFILTDHNGGFLPATDEGSFSFRPRGDHREIYRLESTAKLIPSEYIVRDYNYRSPRLELGARADVDGGGGRVVEYGAHFKTNDEAARIAKVRSEEALAARRVLDGESDLPQIRAGSTFKLDGHPWGDLELLVTEVTHAIRQSALGGGTGEVTRYASTFKAIRQSTAYRPPRITPKPKVSGVLTGVVDASKVSQYAELDSEGRYKVKFLFDTSETPGGQASRPVRMMQPHAGAGYGMHFPLRAGVEVLIVCVDGDPDRPIIAGTVPNPQTGSPVASGNAPRNIIRTGGNNEINIDDTEDGQRIKLTTPKANTLLQLGAHNDPVEGISLKTDGHASNAAIEGSSQWSTLSIQMTALVDLLKSSNVINVASAPNVWALAGAGIDLYQSVVAGTPGTDLIYEASRSNIEKRRQELFKKEAERLKLAIVASQAAKAKQEECNLCKMAAKNSLPSPQDPAIQQLIADYEAAATLCDDTFLTAIGTLEDRNGIVDANRFGFLNDNFEPVMNRDAYASVATYDYAKFESIMVGVDNAAWEALGPTKQAQLVNPNDPGTDAQKLAAAKARFLAERKQNWITAPVDDASATYYAAQRTAKEAEFDGLSTAAKNAIPSAVWQAAGITGNDVGNFDSLTNDQKAALKAAYVNAALPDPPDAKRVRDAKLAELMTALGANSSYDAYKAALLGCAAKCGSELDAARENAIQTNENYSQFMRDNTPELFRLQDLSNQTQTMQANYTSLAINSLLTLFAVIEMFMARSSAIERWNAVKEVAKNSAAQLEATTVHSKIKTWQIPFLNPQHTHVVGSEQTTEVYGQRDVLVWSKTAMLLGMGSEEDVGFWAKAKALGMAQLPGSPGATPDKAVGKAIVMGMEAAQVLSPTRVTLQAGWDPNAIDKRNRASLKLEAKKMRGVVRNGANVKKAFLDVEVDGNDAGKVNLGVDGARALEILEHQPKTTLQSSAGYKLELDEHNQKTTLMATAVHKLELDAAGTASLLKGGGWDLKLHDGPANGVTLGVDAGWRLKIKDNDIELGQPDGGAKLHVTNADTTLRAAAKLKLAGPGNIELVAPTVDFAGAQINSANLLVKADLANQPVIQLLQLGINGAKQRAQMAMAAAFSAADQARVAIDMIRPCIMDLPDIDEDLEI
ncbi:MAG: type VI secretion system tip protein TssI/VgrG [Polyangiaceae bacterium]